MNQYTSFAHNTILCNNVSDNHIAAFPLSLSKCQGCSYSPFICLNRFKKKMSPTMFLDGAVVAYL